MIISLIQDLYRLLDKRQKKKFLFFQILIVISAIFETLSVLSIAPFMAIVSDFSLIDSSAPLSYLYNFLNFTDKNTFVVFFGIIVLATFFISSILSIYTLWKLSLFGAHFGMGLGDRLYEFYLSSDLKFHIEHNSSDLSKQILEESFRVSDNLIIPMLLMNAKIVVAVIMILAMFFFNPSITLIGTIIFITSYSLIYSFLKPILQNNSKQISLSSAKRLKKISEGFKSIKEIIIFNNQDFFISPFRRAGFGLANARGKNLGITITPRYFIEFIAFGSIIILMLITLTFNMQSIESLLPTLSFFAFASLKLMPCLQQIYAGVSQVRGNINAFHSIKGDLTSFKEIHQESKITKNLKEIKFVNSIQLRDVSFELQPSNRILSNINLEIKKGSIVALVGPSGSGKTTISDLLLGLHMPTSGKLSIDNIDLDKKSIASWKMRCAIVPQESNLIDESIRTNISLKHEAEDINYNLLSDAISLSQLDNVINEKKDGLLSYVGEWGSRLSGGQRQRISIARALYKNADFIVFDEPTSALDLSTEKEIINSIFNLKGIKTCLVISHNLKTIAECDQVIYIDNGEINDTGPYSELIKRNQKFRNFSENYT